MIYFLALLIGVVAGLRAMTAPAAVSWAAALGYSSAGRICDRPIAFDAQPQGAAAIRCAADQRRFLRRGDRHSGDCGQNLVKRC